MRWLRVIISPLILPLEYFHLSANTYSYRTCPTSWYLNTLTSWKMFIKTCEKIPSIIKNFVTGFPMFSLHLLSAQERGRRSYRIIHYIVIITNFFIISLIKNNIHQYLYQYISAIDDFALYFKKNKNDTIKKRVKKIGTSSSRKFVTSQHILLKCWSEQFVFKSYN